MPHLPSGRHLGIETHSLESLIEADPRNTRLPELLRIRTPEHLYPYLNVVAFEPNPEGHDVTLSAESDPLPPGLRSRLTPYTVATLPVGRPERSWPDWSASDDTAWREFLASPRMHARLEALLALVEARRDALRHHGTPHEQTQIQLWDTGCHPMQGEHGDTQAIARRLMEMVAVLHDRGHQRLDFLPHFAGAGYYRYLLTVEHPPRFPREGEDPDVATTVWGSLAGGAGLPWVEDPLASPVSLAEAFLARYPRIARLSVGERPGVARWYGEMMRVTGPFGVVVHWLDGAGLERGWAQVIGKEGMDLVALPAELAGVVPPFEE